MPVWPQTNTYIASPSSLHADAAQSHADFSSPSHTALASSHAHIPPSSHTQLRINYCTLTYPHVSAVTFPHLHVQTCHRPVKLRQAYRQADTTLHHTFTNCFITRYSGKHVCYSPIYLFTYLSIYLFTCRSQWPRGLRRGCAAARFLGLRVRTPPGTWMFLCCECCLLSCRGLCVGLITRPEASYRVWCLTECDGEAPKLRKPWPTGGCRAIGKNLFIYLFIS
jgi:hypothetical protein